MYTQVASQLHNRAGWLMAGRYDLIVAQYRYPLLVQLGKRRILVRTEDEAMAMLSLQHADCLGRGIVGLQPRLKAMDLPREDRFRVWVDWREQALADGDPRGSSAVYYCRQTESGLRFEMIEYTRLSTPELQPHFAALALSA